MLVSAIITTKNEERNIENCLDSLIRQSFKREEMEIIIVDNNSADKTKEIAEKYTSMVFDKGPERSAQRNLGAKKAQGNYLLYLDADMALSSEVIKECYKKMESDSNLAGLYIPEIISGKSFWSQVRRFERSFYDGTVIDAVRFIRKDIFEKIGGFDENLTGPEDWDLDKKIRELGKTAVIKSPLYHNEESFQLKNYLQKKTYYGKDFEKYIAKWGKNDPDIRKQFGIGYRYFGVFWEKRRWKKLICHPILVAGIYLLRFLVGVEYLKLKGLKN